MIQHRILTDDKSYTFRDYFKMPYGTDEIVAEFGYELQVLSLQLPQGNRTPERLDEIYQQILELLPLVRPANETAKRETLVAPIVMELTRFLKCQLRIEYPLIVNQWLKGELDYLLRASNQFAIIEAKRDNLDRGFTQLATELIALVHSEECHIIYGAVTTGTVWQFGKLDRGKQTIYQDITLYRVLNELKELMTIFVGILENTQH